LLRTVAGVDLGRLLATLNERVAALLDRDHQIGHSYLMLKESASGNDLRFVWYHRIVPLLQEYFYNDGGRLRAVLGDGFVKKSGASTEVAKALGDFYDAEAAKYEIVPLQGDKFLDALKQLVGAAETEAAE